MYKVAFLVFGFYSSILVAQQSTWLKGSNNTTAQGVYGTMGISGPGNTPGVRTGAVQWTDNAGNFWLFGGYGKASNNFNIGYLSDLWKYTPSTNEWTWMGGDSYTDQTGIYGTQGVSSPSNKPGGRANSTGCTDSNGNFWLFGGHGLSSTTVTGTLNDLWKFDPSLGQWTWVSGTTQPWQNASYGMQGVPSTSNIPGSRRSSCSWFSGSSFYLFAGDGLITTGNVISELNDLWRYDVLTAQWTWLKGSNQFQSQGVYGFPGIPSSTIQPGARRGAQGIKDSNGIFWLIGGEGVGINNAIGRLIDVWKYDPGTNNWTFMKGSNVLDPPGSYGQSTVFSSVNSPGGRAWHSVIPDGTGKFILFGGFGVDGQSSPVFYLNDIWLYDPVINNWAWFAGSQLINALGVYGTQGVPSPFNFPGARMTSCMWLDTFGDVYIFGGTGFSSSPMGNLNDLWKISNCYSTSFSLNVTSSQLNVCSGSQVTLNVTGGNTFTWSTNQVGPMIVIAPTVTSTYSVISTAVNGCTAQSLYTQSVAAAPLLTVSSSAQTLCIGQSATITAIGASNYTWSNGVQSSTVVTTPTSSIVYTITGSNASGCKSSTIIQVAVSKCADFNELAIAKVLKVYPNPSRNEVVISSDSNIQLKLVDFVGRILNMIFINQGDDYSMQISDLPDGVYYLMGENASGKVNQKIVISR